VIVAAPIFPPVTSGCVAGVVWPAGMKTLDGDILTTSGSLLVRSNTVPAPVLGAPKVTGKGSDWPNVRETADKVIAPAEKTLTLTVDSEISGSALTRTLVVPTATPAMGITAVVPPAGIVAVDGTLATAGLSDLTERLIAEGVGQASANITFSVDPRWMDWLCGPERAADTCTVWLLPMRPYAEALTVADPKLTPLTRGNAYGTVEPPGT